MTNKSNFNGSTDGISEVVGVIILIAIVFVFAVVIASTQFHLKSYSVAVTANRLSDNTITISNMGGQDNDQLKDDTPFTITIDGNDCTYQGVVPMGVDLTVDPPGDENHWSLNKKISSSITLRGTALSQIGNGNVHVVVVGNFIDGTKQVVLDTEV
jgi:flagellin-like protein